MPTSLPTPIRSLALSLALVAILGGCGGVLERTRAAPDAAATGAELIRSELYFGRARPGGALVSDAEWEVFVDTQLTPHFPDGLTVLDATGRYRDRAGAVVREPTKVVVLVHPPGSRSRAAIEAVRAAYRQRFDQESVLLVTAAARVSF